MKVNARRRGCGESFARASSSATSLPASGFLLVGNRTAAVVVPITIHAGSRRMRSCSRPRSLGHAGAAARAGQARPRHWRSGLLGVGDGERAEAQRLQLDKSLGIALVVGAAIVFEAA